MTDGNGNKLHLASYKNIRSLICNTSAKINEVLVEGGGGNQ